jgi:ligand-binding sensor domain-containing protein
VKSLKIFTTCLILISSYCNLSIAQGQWNYFTEENDQLFPSSSKFVFEDNMNNIWVGTDLWLYMFNGNNWNRFTGDNGLISSNVTTIMQDSKGTIWVGTSGGISTYKDGILSETETTIWKKEGFPKLYISCIYEDSKANIWFGAGKVKSSAFDRASTGALYKFDGDTCIYVDDYQEFNSHPISEIMEDENGGIWVASGWIDKGVGIDEVFTGNLSLYKDGVWNYYIDKIPFKPEWIIHDIYKDLSGNLWFRARSNRKTNIVIKYDGDKLNYFSKSNNLLNIVKHFYEDSKGRLWFGLANGIAYQENGDYKYLKNENYVNIPCNVQVIKEDSGNNIWVGTTGGVYVITKDERKKFTINNGLSGESNIVIMIAEDFEGKIWILTKDQGLFSTDYYISKINSANWSLESIPLDKIYNNEDIYKIHEDSYKNLWFFADDGITKYSK